MQSADEPLRMPELTIEPSRRGWRVVQVWHDGSRKVMRQRFATKHEAEDFVLSARPRMQRLIDRLNRELLG